MHNWSVRSDKLDLATGVGSRGRAPMAQWVSTWYVWEARGSLMGLNPYLVESAINSRYIVLELSRITGQLAGCREWGKWSWKTHCAFGIRNVVS